MPFRVLQRFGVGFDMEQRPAAGLPLAIRVRLHLVTAERSGKAESGLRRERTEIHHLDEALNSSTASMRLAASPIVEPSDPAADPLASIPTRQIERIVLLQPLTGPMPQPGTDEDGLDAVADASMQEAMR